jgi:hypothetical protein
VTAPGAVRSIDLGNLDLAGLVDGCVENLLAVYDEQRAMFPYSTSLVEGRFVNDYDHPQVIRYTINTLLGLNEAARSGRSGLSSNDVATMTEAFLRQNTARIDTCADHGLLALLLSDYWDPECGELADSLAALDRVLDASPERSLNMQDLAWAIWGASAAARRGVDTAEGIAAAAFDVVRTGFVDPRSGFPRHSTHRYRRGIVSFGSLVYFLRSMDEYAGASGSNEAAQLYENGVRRAIELQGPLGEWPWMLDVASATAFDAYPVFSVHQDSMAMLFLLPAHDRGLLELDGVVAQSLSWGFESNQLSVDFYPRNPFHAYRSIERVERWPRARRYARALRRSAGGGAAFVERGVRVNPECRSYHLGWILFVWAGRQESSQLGRPEGQAAASAPPSSERLAQPER